MKTEKEEIGREIILRKEQPEETEKIFYCAKCEVQLRDSSSYLEHINGKQHNKNLGMSMVVERVGIDKVRERLAGLKRKHNQI